MAGLLHPHAVLGYVRDTADLEKQLVEGYAAGGWPGDPRLSLHQGVITDQKGTVLARRWEVWRDCEDGKDRLIAHWRMEEYDQIIYDLTRMRAESPGHVDVNDSLDAKNSEVEKANSQQFRDSMGEMMEHGAKLAHDTTEPKQVFRGMPGFRKDD